MKFVELKKSLVNQISPCYLIYGEDNFLIETSLSHIEKSLFGNVVRNNLNKQVFSTEEMDNSTFFNALNTLPFFAEKKLVVLKHYSSKLSSETLSQLKEYLKTPNPSTVLVIMCYLDSSNFESIKKTAQIVDCSRLDKNMTAQWILSKIKATPNASIDQQAINLLIDYTNGYLSKISLELDKLLALSDGNITPEHVKNSVTKDLEYSIFELTNNLASKNYERVQLIKNDLMSNRKTMNSVIAVIQNYYRRLFYCYISNGTNSEIANKLKIKEYAVVIAKQQAQKVGAKKLKTIVELCANLDYKIKSGKISLENATEYLLMFIITLLK